MNKGLYIIAIIAFILGFVLGYGLGFKDAIEWGVKKVVYFIQLEDVNIDKLVWAITQYKDKIDLTYPG